MIDRLKFYGAILLCLLLICLGASALTNPSLVSVTDSAKIDSKIVDKGIYTWSLSFESIKPSGLAKTPTTFLKVRKVTYPKKQLETCLTRRTQKYCLGLADKTMTKQKNNIIKQEEDLLKKIKK